MEARAQSKYVKISPIKTRQVLGLIQGKTVEEAINILHYTPKRAAKIVEKTLLSAVANFMQDDEGSKLSPDEIYIKKAYVDGGPMLKRFRPMSMGRVGRIRRRTSHITIIVEDRK